MTCSEGCHQGLQLRRRGALDHAVYQRAPRSRESQARTVRSVRGQDGADGESVQPAEGGDDLGGPGPVHRVGGPATDAVAGFTPSSVREAFAVFSPRVRCSHVRTLRASRR